MDDRVPVRRRLFLDGHAGGVHVRQQVHPGHRRSQVAQVSAGRNVEHGGRALVRAKYVTCFVAVKKSYIFKQTNFSSLLGSASRTERGRTERGVHAFRRQDRADDASELRLPPRVLDEGGSGSFLEVHLRGRLGHGSSSPVLQMSVI